MIHGSEISMLSETQAEPTIVTLAPNLTEIIFSLGQGRRIIGVTSFDAWPESVHKLTKLGGYFNPDIEALLRLKPDMIFMLQGRSDLKTRLQKFGFSVWDFRCETLADIRSTIQQIGNILNLDDKAKEQIERLDVGLQAARLTFEPVPKVMIAIGMTDGVLQNLYVAGGASFHDDVLEAIGVRNVFSNVNQAYFAVGRESILAAQPDIIIDLIPGEPLTEKRRTERAATWSSLGNIPAVRYQRIIMLNDDYITIPGPRVIQIARLFSEHITSLWKPDHDKP
ncbi:MAG: helical backbone metal receptor [bacterium]